MKPRLLVLATLLFTAVPLAFTEDASTNKRIVEPPQIQTAVAQSGSQANEAVADVLAIAPQMPRGPVEILQEYENEMTSISQTFSAEMAIITQAVRQGQITREQADYLMQQTFQISMMQYEVVSALHDTLAVEISRTSVSPHAQAPEAETTIVVQPPFPVQSSPSAPRSN
ncbi:MAG TPA: hypothetical protein VMT53_23660 [Terriglobales bacterium]|nr:hypothetical protein [Terriglobales bacterium]